MENKPDPAAETPEPEDETSARDQVKSPSGAGVPKLYAPDEEGLAPSSIDDAIEGFLVDPRRYGARAALRVVSAWVRENRRLIDEISRAHSEIAALKASNRQRRKHQPLVILGFVLAPILFGIGVELIKSESYGFGTAVLVSSITLLGVAICVGYLAKGDD